MHPARRSRQLPPEPDLASVIADAEETRARIDDALAQIAALASRPYAPGAYAPVSAGLRQAGAELARYVAELSRCHDDRLLTDMTLGAAEAAGFKQGVAARGGRHRAPSRPGRGQLTLLPGAAGADGGPPGGPVVRRPAVEAAGYGDWWCEDDEPTLRLAGL